MTALKRGVSGDTEAVRKAETVRQAFKRPAWWVLIFGWFLAFCAGGVNAICFRAFGRFVSHATGATTSIALGIEGYADGRHGWTEPDDAIKLLSCFLGGCFACGLLVDKNSVHFGGKALYGAALVGNAMLLLIAVLVYDAFGDGLASSCLAATACGLQNAMCTSHFGAVVRTTHVTGTITDIGSTTGRMAMTLFRSRMRRRGLNALEHAEVGVDARKLLVLGPMWLSFFAGTFVGAVLHSRLGTLGLLFPASFTFAVGLSYMLFRPQMKMQLKSIERHRLKKSVGKINETIQRTKSFVMEANANAAHDGTPPEVNQEVAELQKELGRVLNTVRQVEAAIDQAYGGHEGGQSGTPMPGHPATIWEGGEDENTQYEGGYTSQPIAPLGPSSFAKE